MTNIKLKKKLRTCPRTTGSPSQGHVPDINNNDNNINIYINLFNIYIKQIQNKPFFEKVKMISELKETEEYNKLDDETQKQLFMDLMSVK